MMFDRAKVLGELRGRITIRNKNDNDTKPNISASGRTYNVYLKRGRMLRKNLMKSDI